MKEKLLSHFKQDLDLVSEMRKISAFIDLSLLETLKKEKDEQLVFLYKQLLSLKDYIGSEVSFNLTQEENAKFLLDLNQDTQDPPVEFKKKESESEEKLQQLDPSSETDRSTLQKEEEK